MPEAAPGRAIPLHETSLNGMAADRHACLPQPCSADELQSIRR